MPGGDTQAGLYEHSKGMVPAHHPWVMLYREFYGFMMLEDPREGFTLTRVSLLPLFMAGFGG